MKYTKEQIDEICEKVYLKRYESQEGIIPLMSGQAKRRAGAYKPVLLALIETMEELDERSNNAGENQ